MEIWKEHTECACLVSNLGSVKYLDNTDVGMLNAPYLSARVSTRRYKPVLRPVHKLVVECFVGNIPKNMCVNHIDGNKHNNSASNLEIVTYAQNTQHAVDLGLLTFKRGEEVYCSILKEVHVLEIYAHIKAGLTNNQIADMYNVNFRTVSLIRNGLRWKHLFDVHMQTPMKSKSTDKTLDFCFTVLDDLNTLINKQIADKHKLEPSLVSRVRSKSTWKQVWLIYEKRATTIENTSQDGNE
jgi:hypothetical protein